MLRRLGKLMPTRCHTLDISGSAAEVHSTDGDFQRVAAPAGGRGGRCAPPALTAEVLSSGEVSGLQCGECGEQLRSTPCAGREVHHCAACGQTILRRGSQGAGSPPATPGNGSARTVLLWSPSGGLVSRGSPRSASKRSLGSNRSRRSQAETREVQQLLAEAASPSEYRRRTMLHGVQDEPLNLRSRTKGA
mmetsp:Transcript_45662/g.132236  ORF Transcript_45662/g.132236 Transcript_45662/m.132236 type:complete len:191 (+) Transcript_45662:50-622(+)